MSKGIFRPRQVIQRITPNGGNRYYIAGGIGVNRVKLAQPKAPPAPPAAPAAQEGGS